MSATRLLTLALLTTGATFAHASWPKIFSGSNGTFDSGTQIAMDSDANVYVVGNVVSTPGTNDILIAKYSQNGSTQWTQKWDSSGDDYAADIAVDEDGNVYVTGRSNGFTASFDIVTIKFDTDGDKKWSRTIDGSGHGDDFAAAVKVDHLGNVVIAGTQVGPSENYLTAKYTSNGGKLWDKGYDGPASGKDNAVDLVIGDDDSVYITGFAETPTYGCDYATIKYTPTGSRAWLRTLDGQGHGIDIPAGIAIDENQDIIVSGTSEGFISNDIFTVRYGESGIKEWQLRLGSFGVNEYANAVSMDAVGNSYIVGTSGDGDDCKVMIIMLYEGGEKAWSKTYSASAGASYNAGVGIDVSNEGVVYVGATTSSDNTAASIRMTILKYSNSGDRIGAERFGIGSGDSAGKGFALDKTTFKSFITGYAFNAANNSYDVFTARK